MLVTSAARIHQQSAISLALEKGHIFGLESPGCWWMTVDL